MRLDYELKREDIQQLGNADAIAGFFARLGYDTEARIAQTPENLGITADGAIRPIERIELIADQEGLFQVYLFELKSVTVSHTRALTRAFRNRAGNYLFVLTTADYDRLDFVLLEKHVPQRAERPTGLAQPQVAVRPRTLTVDRRKSAPCHLRARLRVLRRFTYTESDPFAQYDKLISAYDVAYWSEEFFNNRALFSDYYLLDRLRDMPEWAEDPKPAFMALRNLYDGASSTFRNQPEQRLRSDLLEPALERLGFTFRHGKKAGSDAGTPDYVLASPGARDVPIAMCLAYPWGRSLDGKDYERDSESPEENPGALVVSLLESGEAPWAIVTNGKVWRLYSQQTHSRATNYYEIDLEEVLAQGGPLTSDPAEAFRYFWLFFRREAFEPRAESIEGEKKTLTFLDKLVVESQAFAKELGERLKERIFFEVFPHLAEGYIANIRAQEGPNADISQERLDAIFQGTLTLLYRLLFLLYAESRDLLPAKEERGYYEISLSRLRKDIAEAGGAIEDERDGQLRKKYESTEATIYGLLTKLFTIVDRGDGSVNVPVYNGGLFITEPEPEDDSVEAGNARFLGGFNVPDLFLAMAIDRLARDIDPKRQDLVPIDFKSLGVRQLGSIYEGLLEFKLRIAPTKMAIVKGKKTERIVPYDEAEPKEILKAGRGANAEERTLPEGAVYLENNKRERKATGSYYTPDHIVNYIVENAVGPVLAEKFDAVRPKIREAEKARRAFFKKQEAMKKSGIAPEPESKADLIGRELVDEIIDIKVLDPAMGSGHFLVEAVDFVTDKTIDFLNGFGWNPVFAHLDLMRRTILKEMDEQGVSIDPKRLTDVNLLKRHILKKCIYGVDLNPMAVELAKVSLWLDCFTLGAPLSFLDHHLRCGNSLIGVTVKEVRDELEGGQGLLWGSQFAGLLLASDLMRHVGDLSDVTSSQVRQSRAEYRKASDALAPFKRMLDVYTSQWFGNEPYQTGKGRSAQTLSPPIDFLKSQEAEPWIQDPSQIDHLSDFGRKVAATALKAAASKRFFHWELEFPEVFYGPREGSRQAIERIEGAGFDVVIGNPPYDVLAEKELGYDISSDIAYYEAYPVHAAAIRGKKNLYKLFICRGEWLLNADAAFSFIVPMPILGDDQAAEVRRSLLQNSHPSAFEAFPQKDDPKKRVFEEAKLATAIFVVHSKPRGERFLMRTHPGRTIEPSSPSVYLQREGVTAFDPLNSAIPACSQEDWDLALKIVMQEPIVRLGDLAKSFQGEVNETNERRRGAFTSDNTAPLILRGANICTYAVRKASQGEDIHLDVSRFLAGKEQESKAFAHQSERLGFQRSSPQNNFRRIIAALLKQGCFCFDTVSYVPRESTEVDLDLLVAVLNSKLLDWYFRLGSTNSKVNEYQFNALPAPQIQNQTSVGPMVLSLEREDLPTSKEKLLGLCREPGTIPKEVADAVAILSRKIQAIEADRHLSRRSERAFLAPESQKLQDVIDAVLFRCYGLTDAEAAYVEHRLEEML